MRIFRRRNKRVRLGTYEAPEPVEPAPVESIVEDGMLIADSVVRMALRNRVIVNALRDRADLDREELTTAAAAELEALADQEWESAQRVRFRRESVRNDDPFPEDADGVDEHRRESERREMVHKAMSEGFAARAKSSDILESLVERSRAEAWAEIAEVIVARASHEELAPDADYDALRTERIGALLALDLSALAAERGVVLD